MKIGFISSFSNYFNCLRHWIFLQKMQTSSILTTTNPTNNINKMLEVGIPISTEGTIVNKRFLMKNMLPRGSALLTTSGELVRSGITAIIHAATGSIQRDKYGPDSEPTLESISKSIKNCIYLANRYEHKKIAIPFIGSGIFLKRILTKDPTITTEKLCEIIIQSVLDSILIIHDIQVRFIVYNNLPRECPEFHLFQTILIKLFQEHHINDVDVTSKLQVLQGDITSFALHECTAIVNASNMEVKFGGGLSGVIAKATKYQDDIDREASIAIQAYKLEKFKEKKW